MRITPVRRASLARPNGRTLNPWCFESCSGERATFSLQSGAWISANDPVACGFVMRETGIVDRLGIVNGSAAGDNFDIGIYDLSWNRLISTGSTAAVGNSAAHYVDVANTVLTVGRYWVVVVRDTITANRQMFSAGLGSVQTMEMIGAQDSTTDAFPLPNPLTNMALVTAATRPPVYLIDLV